MTLASRLFGLVARLPRAETYAVTVERDLAIPMPDGAVLRADRYAPRGAGPLPTILVRSPYGRSGAFGLMYGRLFAERGFQVVMVSVRGTADSDGCFNPFQQERADGLATLAWLRTQPWFDGRLATNGASYLGLVQWAIAAAAAPELRAMATQVTAPDFRRLTYPGEAFALDNAIAWTASVTNQLPTGPNMRANNSRERRRRLELAHATLPLADADRIVLGSHVDFFQDWLRHEQPGDPWWAAQDHWADVPAVAVPVQLLGGWYDIFLPDTVRQYAVLRAAGRTPQLIIGPWAHTDASMLAAAIRESLAWLRAHLLGDRSHLRAAPVSVYVMGARKWRTFDEWPPASTQLQRWYLRDQRRLGLGAPLAGEPDRFRYDPADPTPAVGGAILNPPSGRKSQAPLDARSDVLRYTSAVLERDLEVIGPIVAEVWLRASVPHTDLFVSLCDVDRRGRSTNISDGFLRLTPTSPTANADGVRQVKLELGPTAHRFRRGHRVRVQIAGGAHPRFARNPGSGEPLATATTLVASDHEIFHDPEHPSSILLSVIG